MKKSKLNIENFKKLQCYLDANADVVSLDQDTYGDQLRRGAVCQPVSTLDCGTPGCMAYHVVKACAPRTLRVDYAKIAPVAQKLLGLPKGHLLFQPGASGWPEDIKCIYRMRHDNGIHRRLALQELVRRIIKEKRLPEGCVLPV